MSDEDVVTRVLIDAQERHHVKIDASDPNVKALVSYALTVGYNMGWKDHKYSRGLQEVAELSDKKRSEKT